MLDAEGVLYWDASAVLSLLFEDQHSAMAIAQMQERRVHLVSSLTWAESHAVIKRMRRMGAISDAAVTLALEQLDHAPWRRISAGPDRKITRAMASRWALRGADLWHLALARTLQRDLHEIRLVTYDEALREAAMGEGLATP